MSNETDKATAMYVCPECGLTADAPGDCYHGNRDNFPTAMVCRQAGATPRPWRIDGGTNKKGDLFVHLDDDTVAGETCVATVHNWMAEGARANAALIVRAVNSHDALVEACEKATNKLAESTGLVGVPMYAKCRKDYEADMLDIIREARAAMALAGKVTK